MQEDFVRRWNYNKYGYGDVSIYPEIIYNMSLTEIIN